MRDTSTIKTCRTCGRPFVSQGEGSCDPCAVAENRARLGLVGRL